jgi:hypothetical protein
MGMRRTKRPLDDVLAMAGHVEPPIEWRQESPQTYRMSIGIHPPAEAQAVTFLFDIQME